MSMTGGGSKVVQTGGQLEVMWHCVLVENGREKVKTREVVHDEEVESVVA